MTPVRLLVLWALLSAPAAIAIAALLRACRQRTIGEEAEAFLRSQLGEQIRRSASARPIVVVVLLASLAVVSYRAAGDLPRHLVDVATARDIIDPADDAHAAPTTTSPRAHADRSAGRAPRTDALTGTDDGTVTGAAGAIAPEAAATDAGATTDELADPTTTTTVKDSTDAPSARATTTTSAPPPVLSGGGGGRRSVATTTTTTTAPPEETTTTTAPPEETTTTTTAPPEETTTTTTSTTAPPEESSPDTGTTTTTTSEPQPPTE